VPGDWQADGHISSDDSCIALATAEVLHRRGDGTRTRGQFSSALVADDFTKTERPLCWKPAGTESHELRTSSKWSPAGRARPPRSRMLTLARSQSQPHRALDRLKTCARRSDKMKRFGKPRAIRPTRPMRIRRRPARCYRFHRLRRIPQIPCKITDLMNLPCTAKERSAQIILGINVINKCSCYSHRGKFTGH
jgi:hypothetical protein